MIRITRVRPYGELLRSYKIFIDGTCRGRIGIDETLEFEVENGNHIVCAKLDWCRSNKVCVNVNDSVVELEVGSAVVGWRLFLWKLYATVWAHKALWLREKETVATASKATK